MLTHPIDSDRLRKEIETLVAQCIELKTVLRTRWTRPMAEDQKRLIRVRRSLTERFILLGASRKKPRLHVIHAPRELRDPPSFDRKAWDALAYNTAIALRVASEYQITSTAPASVEEAAVSQPS